MCSDEEYIRYRKGFVTKEKYLSYFPDEIEQIEREEEVRAREKLVKKLVK
jgi:hypothetical protein